MTTGTTADNIGTVMMTLALLWVTSYFVWRALLWAWVRARWQMRGFGHRQLTKWQPQVRAAIEAVPEIRDARRFAYDLTVRGPRSQAQLYTVIVTGSVTAGGAVTRAVARHLEWTGAWYALVVVTLAFAGAIAGEFLTIGAYGAYSKLTTEPLQRAALAACAALRNPRHPGYQTRAQRAETSSRVLRTYELAGIPTGDMEALRIASTDSDPLWAVFQGLAVDRLGRAYGGDYVHAELEEGGSPGRPAAWASALAVAASIATVIGTLLALVASWPTAFHR